MLMKKFNRFGVQLQDILLELPGLSAARRAFGNNDADFIRQESDSLGKLEPFQMHNKADDVSAGRASETMIDLFVGRDHERRRFFMMKRTKSFKIPACTS